MCKWTEADFAHKPTRDQIPFSDFKGCDQTFSIVEVGLRAELAPTPAPESQAAVTGNVALVLLGVGIGLLTRQAGRMTWIKKAH